MRSDGEDSQSLRRKARRREMMLSINKNGFWTGKSADGLWEMYISVGPKVRPANSSRHPTVVASPLCLPLDAVIQSIRRIIVVIP